MSKAPQRLYGARQVRDLDRVAIDDLGIDGYELMRRAGLAGYRLLRYCFPRARRVAVYCGSGNNGGDGYVLAALALAAGMEVRLVAVGRAKTATARRAVADFEKAGGVVLPWDDELPGEVDAVVDALLGTGLEQAPAGDYGKAIERINSAGCPVLALDIPSGLHADTGRALEPCVHADATATFIGRKLGCFTGDGRGVVGRLYFDELGVPGEVYERVTWACELIEPRLYAAVIAGRSPTAHKGDAGRVLVVGGNHGMPGAPCLSARAAHRTGAGLVYLATRSRPEDLVPSTLETIAARIDSARDLEPMLANADVVAVGPGLGRDEWAREVWDLVSSADRPLIVDADALHFLAQAGARREDWVLTPHPGEASRLLGTDAKTVQADRPGAARALQERFGGVIVLKGSGTLVQGRSLHLCGLGNPGMASGGMGDVLTGIVAALRGQGLPAEDAACYGVWCHARAGDEAAQRGQVGVTAGSLVDGLQGIVGGLAW